MYNKFDRAQQIVWKWKYQIENQWNLKQFFHQIVHPQPNCPFSAKFHDSKIKAVHKIVPTKTYMNIKSLYVKFLHSGKKGKFSAPLVLDLTVNLQMNSLPLFHYPI